MPDSARLHGVVVLVVDDNADSRAVLAQLLESYGAFVLTADSGVSALRILADVYPHVLLSDIGMADMDGLTLIEKIRSRERDREDAQDVVRHLPAAAVTAFNSDEDRRKCLKAGFRFHIPKPIDFPLLLDRVARLAEGAH